MKASLVLWSIALVFCASCAQVRQGVGHAPPVETRQTIRYASAGGLYIAADQSRFETGEPVTLSGVLELPSSGESFPLVILAHGCNGIGSTEVPWARILRKWGYATFLLDSFKLRGLSESCVDPWALAPTQRIPDVYGALRALSKHPQIDANKIVLMGFSHGGIVAMQAATAWARQHYAPEGQPFFRAFIAFYPNCNVEYPEREVISAPLRVHTGELDDWTPANPCVRLVENLRNTRQDARITVYAGAHHSFDAIGVGFVQLPDAVNAAACSLRIPSILGPFPLQSEIASCLRKGATVVENSGAIEAARRNVRSELNELLK